MADSVDGTRLKWILDSHPMACNFLADSRITRVVPLLKEKATQENLGEPKEFLKKERDMRALLGSLISEKTLGSVISKVSRICSRMFFRYSLKLNVPKLSVVNFDALPQFQFQNTKNCNQLAICSPSSKRLPDRGSPEWRVNALERNSSHRGQH